MPIFGSTGRSASVGSNMSGMMGGGSSGMGMMGGMGGRSTGPSPPVAAASASTNATNINLTSGATAPKPASATEPAPSAATFRGSDFAMGPRMPNKKDEQAFGNLLGDKFKKPQEAEKNKSLASMNRESRVKTEDPVKIAVEAWVEGKEKNVRALLSSLQNILWPGANWKPVSMATLMDNNQVKKAYQKACLLVHPDKVVKGDHEQLAHEIFIELTQAYDLFMGNA